MRQSEKLSNQPSVLTAVYIVDIAGSIRSARPRRMVLRGEPPTFVRMRERPIEGFMPNWRPICCFGLFSLLLLLACGAGHAQDYPSRPLRFIVTTPAGSLVDVLGRLFAQDLGDRLGQTIVVDNRPGAMTQIGADTLNRPPPDRYTLMIGT